MEIASFVTEHHSIEFHPPLEITTRTCSLQHTETSRAFSIGIRNMEPGKERSSVLVIGGTGHIGKHIVAASIRLGHSTSVLVRDATQSDPAKAQLLKSFADSGVALIKVCVTIIPCYLSFNYYFFPQFLNGSHFPSYRKRKGVLNC
jgi:hypothetical protein